MNKKLTLLKHANQSSLKGKNLTAAICVSLIVSTTSLAPVFAEDITYTGDGAELKTIRAGYSTYNNSVFPGTEEAPLAQNNNVTINVTSGANPDYVFGGYSETDLVQNNTVTILSGSINGYVYGGYSESDSASKNTLNISGGSLSSLIVAGRAGKDASGNVIIISDLSSSSYIYAGIASGDAFNNTVSFTESTAAYDIVSGRADNNTYQNTLTINNGIVEGSIYGGTRGDIHIGEIETANIENLSIYNNSVTINGGTLEGNIYGGIVGEFMSAKYSYSGDAINNTVTINSSQNIDISNATLYGGSSSNSNPGDTFAGNTLNVNGFSGSVKGVNNFENYNFALSDTLNSGDTVLNVTDAVDLTDTNISVTGIDPDSNFKAGDNIILVNNVTGSFAKFNGHLPKSFSLVQNISGSAKVVS